MDFTRDELVWLNNALDEVLNGVDAIDDESEFHSRIGGWPAEVRTLLARVHVEVERRG